VVQGDSIESIIASVNTLLLNLQPENNPEAGSLFRILDRLAKITDHLLSVSEALGKSNILNEAETILLTSRDWLNEIPQMLSNINKVIVNADGLVKEANKLVVNYANPALVVGDITEQKIPPMLENFNASLTPLKAMLTDVHGQREQIVLTISTIQKVLNRLDKTLQGLNNNPLLKEGISEDAKNTGIEMND
jgi:phospholipid/cholesterol/gamma-HCH transport system substrate-binding protein